MVSFRRSRLSMSASLRVVRRSIVSFVSAVLLPHELKPPKVTVSSIPPKPSTNDLTGLVIMPPLNMSSRMPLTAPNIRSLRSANILPRPSFNKSRSPSTAPAISPVAPPSVEEKLESAFPTLPSNPGILESDLPNVPERFFTPSNAPDNEPLLICDMADDMEFIASTALSVASLRLLPVALNSPTAPL